MTVGLYFGGREFQTVFGGHYGNIELDALLSEGHSWEAEATENPVEVGAPVTDHVIEKADKLTLKCFVTDAPIVASATVTNGTYNGQDAGTRTQPIFDTLYALIKARLPIVVYTKHAIYSDMIITAINITRTAETGAALEFDVDMVAMRFVQTETVDLPAGVGKKKAARGSASVKKKTDPQAKNGKVQPTTKDKPKATEKPRSTLSHWLN